MSAKTLPAGCKAAKLNLANAYRTTYTHIVAGDVVRVLSKEGAHYRAGEGYVEDVLHYPAATQAPKASFWVQVTKVERKSGGVTITVAGDRELEYNAAHTAITRKERETERQARLEQDAADRAASLAAVETELESKGVTVDPFPGLDVQASINVGMLATGFVSPEEAVAVLQTVGQTAPAELADQLVKIASDNGSTAPYSSVLQSLARDIAYDPASAAYYRAVQAEVVKLRDRAIQVASSAAMRQVGTTPERATGLDAMCLGDFGAYGSCVAVRGHLGLCMDAHGHRFDGANRRRPLLAGDRVTHADFPGEVWEIQFTYGDQGKQYADLVHPVTGDRQKEARWGALTHAHPAIPVQRRREYELAAIYGAESVHDCEPGHSGMVCDRIVMRPDGTGDACGEPVNSPIHDPAAYLAYEKELKTELAAWSRGDEGYDAASAAVESAFPAVASPDRQELETLKATVRKHWKAASRAHSIAFHQGDEKVTAEALSEWRALDKLARDLGLV